MDQSDNKYAKSIALLNDALRKEIATSLQYMYFHVRLEDAGYEYLAKYMFKVSISEMHHAEHIAERILFLGGDADMNPCDPTRQLTDVGDMLQLAVKLETCGGSRVGSHGRYGHIAHVPRHGGRGGAPS